TAADAATWFDEDQPRMRFELPWPAAGGPKNKDLQVVVRYKTADGRTLEAQGGVAVQLTGRRPKPPATAAPSTATLNGPTSAGTGAPAGGTMGDFSALK